MRKLTAVLTLILSLFGAAGAYHLTDPGNPPFCGNMLFRNFEDYNNIKFAQLRAQFKIDTVVAGETDEFKRILLLRNWIRRAMPIANPGRTPGGYDAINLLDSALNGYQFVCTQYSKVQGAVMNAYGYHTQQIGSGPSILGVQDGHHGINVIWSNTYCKWVLSDAMFDHHFEKNGVPLSPLEVRDEWLKNKGADIYRAVGPGRVHTAWDTTLTDLEYYQCPSVYTWIQFLSNCNPFTNSAGFSEGTLYMYADTYATSHVWYWDGKPHWAWSNTSKLVRVPQREKIEWTPGVMTAAATFSGNAAAVTLTSATPNFKEYQINTGGVWSATPANFNLDLTQDHQEWQLRTVNLAGVTGPLFRLVIDTGTPAIRLPVSRANQELRIFAPRVSGAEIEIPFTSGLQEDLFCTIFSASGRVVWRSSPLWDRAGSGIFLAKRPPAGVYFSVLRAETGSAVVRWSVP